MSSKRVIRGHEPVTETIIKNDTPEEGQFNPSDIVTHSIFFEILIQVSWLIFIRLKKPKLYIKFSYKVQLSPELVSVLI